VFPRGAILQRHKRDGYNEQGSGWGRPTSGWDALSGAGRNDVPAPVRAYLEWARVEGRQPIRHVHVRHGGRFSRARDSYQNEVAHMVIGAFSRIPIADVTGPEINISGLITVLAELPFTPKRTATFGSPALGRDRSELRAGDVVRWCTERVGCVPREVSYAQFCATSIEFDRPEC
jgi:hypothetical protein